jgi:hypothetical protein
VLALRNLPNVVAVVLGGSWASGCARPESDLDIGVYYRQKAPFSVEEVRRAALSISTPGTDPVIAGFYEWGPWVNGGAWIQTPSGKVDFLYKNLDQIESTIADAHRGIWSHDFDQQPPFGFRSVVLLGETAISVPLYDPDGIIAALKQSVAEYPEPLRVRVIQECLWGAEFSLWALRGFASSADVYNAAGCMTRVAQFLVHALFALNRRYFVSDKAAGRLISQFPLSPRDFVGRLNAILSCTGATPGELKAVSATLGEFWHQVVELTEGAYQARYDLDVLLKG